MEARKVVCLPLPLLSLAPSIIAGTLCLFTCFLKFSKPFSEKVAGISFLFGTGLTLIVALLMASRVAAGEPLESPEFYFKVDQTNAAAVASVSSIFLVTSVYNVKAERGGRLKPSMYGLFLSLLLCCALGLLLSYDLFSIFIFAKLAMCASAALIVHNPNKLSTEAAFKYLVIATMGAAFALLGISMMFTLAGTSNLSAIVNDQGVQARLRENPRLLLLVTAFLIIGFGTDVGLFPFHGWLPDVFSGSSATVLSLLSAGHVSFMLAGYRLIHAIYRAFPSNVIVALIAGVGLISALFGALLAYRQRDFYRMLAYCSISETGYAIFALGLLTSHSFIAGQYYLVNGALMKAGMILSLGSVSFSSGVRDMDVLSGLLKRMGRTALSYFVCALSLVGVPPLSGFYAKWLLYNSAYASLLPLWGSLTAISVIMLLISVSVILLVFLTNSFHRIFMGELAESLKHVEEVHPAMWLPTAALAAAAVLLGLKPNIILSLIARPSFVYY